MAPYVAIYASSSQSGVCKFHEQFCTSSVVFLSVFCMVQVIYKFLLLDIFNEILFPVKKRGSKGKFGKNLNVNFLNLHTQ